jgi:hypothetical protein
MSGAARFGWLNQPQAGPLILNQTSRAGRGIRFDDDDPATNIS